MFRKSTLIAAALAVATTFSLAPQSARAQEAFIGEIRFFGSTFAPRGWALCNGQLLAISSNQALFSLLGTTYGGDGRTTFALPDARGRAMIHAGQGPGLSSRPLGQTGGNETNTLTAAQMPAHSHALNAATVKADATTPQGTLMGGSGRHRIYSGAAADTAMSGAAVGSTGGGQPVDNMQPYVTTNCIIALQGYYPSRD